MEQKQHFQSVIKDADRLPAHSPVRLIAIRFAQQQLKEGAPTVELILASYELNHSQLRSSATFRKREEWRPLVQQACLLIGNCRWRTLQLLDELFPT